MILAQPFFGFMDGFDHSHSRRRFCVLIVGSRLFWARREGPSFRSPPDGRRRIRDLECSLREERCALREAEMLYRRVAFWCFEQTLFVQPRVFPTKRKQLLVVSQFNDTTVIKHENLVCVHDSG